ncbi:hypothetical protein niasHS_008738 [Heterodera schachtii]|uniref:Uncharacterized protein n=1 Tax=Heterodera schachtii TaxID=97005 RepID=A0ABD2IW06_HETSC
MHSEPKHWRNLSIFVGLIALSNRSETSHRPDYANEGNTQKKLIKNCQSAGDKVFSTGDVLHWDHLGYLYFKAGNFRNY